MGLDPKSPRVLAAVEAQVSGRQDEVIRAEAFVSGFREATQWRLAVADLAARWRALSSAATAVKGEAGGLRIERHDAAILPLIRDLRDARPHGCRLPTGSTMKPSICRAGWEAAPSGRR